MIFSSNIVKPEFTLYNPHGTLFLVAIEHISLL